MRLTLAKAALAKALASVGRVVERRNTIPILANVRLEARGDTLRLTGTDLDMMASASAPAAIAAPGAITVPAATLDGYVRKLPDGAEISLETETVGTGARVTVRSGRSRMALGALPADDFPDLDAGEATHRFALPGQNLARLLTAVSFAMSTEETRYYLNGAFLHPFDGPEGPLLRAVATDGHRLGRADNPAPDGTAGMPGVILPRKAVDEIVRMAEGAGEAEVAVALSISKVRIEAGGATLVSKLVDGTFPDYGRVVPAGNDKAAIFEVDDFARAIERVSTVASEKGRAVKLELEEGRVTIRVNSPDSGEAEESLDCGFDHAPLSLGFNGRYATEILKTLGSDTVTVEIADPASPMLWRAPADPTRLYVLMPMRV